jgi:2,3-bisphosphoglycerate-independent phosphoglycerate mutase
MRKKPFVVCLMDGMGIEDSKSFSIYDSTVMPTLDALTNRYLFSSLESSGKSVGLSADAAATKEIGYLNIGAGSIIKQSIEIVNEKIEKNELFNSPSLKIVTDHVIANNSKLHLITLIGDKYSEDSPQHLRKMIEYCNSIGIKKIYLHLYLGANNNSLNKTFSKYTVLIHRITNLFPNVKISTIAGIKHLKDSSGITVTKELYKITVGGIGEHWLNYNDAVDSNYKRKNLEENIVPFLVADDGLIENTDGVFLFNYENDLGSVYTDLLIQPAKYMYTNNSNINIKIASLFPLQNQTTVSCLTYDQVKTSFYATLNQNGIKHLLVAEKNNIPYLNYYFNGCNNTQATQVLGIEMQESGNYDLDLSNKFQLTTNKAIEAINSDFYDLIIIDYQIVDGNKPRNTENIKNALSNLDKNLAQLYNLIIQKNGIMYITSSYGINEALYNSREELVNVNFSKKVPFVIIDNDISKDIYSLQNGCLSDLSTTIIDQLNIPKMQGMTGNNLLIQRTVSKSKKKKQTKLLLVAVILVAVMVIAVVALMYLGLI